MLYESCREKIDRQVVPVAMSENMMPSGLGCAFSAIPRNPSNSLGCEHARDRNI